MKVLTVHNTMQNQAKSTLAWLLAVAFGEANQRVVVVDTDAQRTLCAYMEINPAIRKPFNVLTLDEYLELKDRVRADLVIFDTERDVTALRPDLALAAFEASDFVLVPCIPDEKALANMAAVCRALDTTFRLERVCGNGPLEPAELKKALLRPDPAPRRRWATIFTRVDPNRSGTELAEIKRTARLYGCNPLATHLSEASAVREVFTRGSLPRIEQATQLAAEADAIRTEVARHLDGPATQPRA